MKSVTQNLRKSVLVLICTTFLPSAAFAVTAAEKQAQAQSMRENRGEKPAVEKQETAVEGRNKILQKRKSKRSNAKQSMGGSGNSP